MAFQTRILKYYFILIGVYTNYNKNKNNPLQTAKPKILFKKWKNTKKYEKNNTIHNGCWRSGPEQGEATKVQKPLQCKKKIYKKKD